MRLSLLLLLLALLTAGCAGGEEQAEPERPSLPRWMSERYADGTISLRYPAWWHETRTERFGAVLADDAGRHPAFVSVRYLREASYSSASDFAELAARTLRPPEGRGLTLLYTQTAQLGGRRGIEAAFVWSTRGDTPAGPTMRAFGVAVPPRRVAFLVFAAERPSAHGDQFGWIKRSIRWHRASKAGGYYVNP